MINMGESFTLTVNGVDVTMEGVFFGPYQNKQLGEVDVDQIRPAMLVKTVDLASLVAQPVKGKSTITRDGGMPMTIFDVKPVGGGKTRLEVAGY